MKGTNFLQPQNLDDRQFTKFYNPAGFNITNYGRNKQTSSRIEQERGLQLLENIACFSVTTERDFVISYIQLRHR